MRKLNFFKTLLVAVGLCAGVNAWADGIEITETYDFGTFISANGAPNLTTSGDGIAQSGTSAKVGTVKVINNLSASSKTLDLNGRFAVDYQYNAGSQIRFIWRSSSTNYQHGLAGNWNNKGTADPQGAARFSVLNLKAGDKITFTYAKQAGKAADPYTCKAGVVTYGSENTAIAVDAPLTSGTQYTVVADGNFDLYFTNNNFAISKIVIVTTGTETVSNPTLAITGAYNKTRKVTITSGTSDAGNDVTTYYTTDGSTPTTSSPNSFTSASKEITVGEGIETEATVTVKAISISSLTTTSSVASEEISVGTKIKLVQPNIIFTNMGLNAGNYYKQYSFTANSSGTYGNPSISITGTFNSDVIANPYTATTAGTISVYASADGYEDSDVATLDVDGNAYLLGRSYDFTQDKYREGLSQEGNNITITGAGVNVFRITDDKLNMIEGLTLSNTNFGITKAQNSDTRKGLTPRWGAGVITINDWITGSFAVLNDEVSGGVYATSSNGTFSFGSQINNNTFTSLNIFVPAESTVSKTITAAGYATYCSPYALNFSGVSGLTAYIAAKDGTKVKFTPVDNVPANTGVLLKGAEGDYSIPVIASSTTDVEDNILTGVLANTSIEIGDYGYVLMNVSNVVGFYKTDTTKGFIVGANTAYIKSDKGLSRMFIGFDDDEVETTGINEVKNVKANNAIYNLKGMKVKTAQKGLYIINGKKVVK